MNWLLFLLPVGLSLVVTAISMPKTKAWFDNLHKPKLNPPSYLFGIVWPVLYLLMGYASSRVSEAGPVPILYWVQLALNLIWSIIFFRLHLIQWALLDIAALWILIVVTVWQFAAIDSVAGWLLAPYLAWVTFASYLNYSFYALNK